MKPRAVHLYNPKRSNLYLEKMSFCGRSGYQTEYRNGQVVRVAGRSGGIILTKEPGEVTCPHCKRSALIV